MKQNNKIRPILIIAALLLLSVLGVHILTVVGQIDPNILWYGTIKNYEALRLAGLFSTILYLIFIYGLYMMAFKWQNKTALSLSKKIFALAIGYFILSAIGAFRSDTAFHKLALTLLYLFLAFLFYLLRAMSGALIQKETRKVKKRNKRRKKASGKG